MRQNKKKNKLKHIRATKNRKSIREQRKEKKKLKTNNLANKELGLTDEMIRFLSILRREQKIYQNR